MKLTKAEQAILWNRVDENMHLVDKITHDAQQTIQKKINLIDQRQLYNVSEKAKSPQARKNFKISKKLIAINFKQEQKKANLIRNKMAYMHLTQYKQQKSIQIAKRNLTRIANIRLNSLRERQNLSKLRQSLCLQQYEEKQMKAREIKSSRKTRQKAIQTWKNSLKQTAQGTRAQKNMYHTISFQQKKLQREINLQKASNVKKSLEKSRISIEQAASLKIQITKQRYQYDLQSRYQLLSSEKKKNEKLYQIFKSETEKANDWQQQKKKQINHLKSLWIQNNENPETVQLEQF